MSTWLNLLRCVRRSVSCSVLQSLLVSGVLGRVMAGLHAATPHCLAFRRSCFYGSSQWWTLLPGWCSRHRSATQSLRFSIDFIGWGLRRESTSNSLVWRSTVCMAQRRRTSLTNSSRLEVVSAQRRHRQQRIVRRTLLFTVDDRAFPVVAARVWNELPRHVSSAPFSAVVW